MNQSKQQTKDSKLFEMQDDLLKARKQLSCKQNQWKRQKLHIAQSNQILQMQIAELKHREINLKKINQTLTNIIKQFQKAENVELINLLEQIKNNNIITIESSRKDDKLDREASQRQLRLKLQQQYKIKQQKLKSEIQKFFEEKYNHRIKQLETIFYRNLNIEKEKLEKQIKKKYYEEVEYFKMENFKLANQNSRLTDQINSRKNINHSIYDDPFSNHELKTSTLIPGHQNYKDCNFTSKKSLYDQISTNNNIATDLLCEVCKNIYSTNQFHEHLIYCKYQQATEQSQQQTQQSGYYDELLSKKKFIKQSIKSIEEFQRAESKKEEKVYYVFSDLNKSKKNDQHKNIKKILKTLSLNTPDKNQSNISIIKYSNQNDISRKYPSKNTLLKSHKRKHN